MQGDLTARAEAFGAPSANGELVFDEPWQGRVLSMAVHLSDRGEFAWDDFRAKLVDEISERPEEGYYVQFLRALEKTLLHGRLLAATEISDRMRVITHAPHDHIRRN